MYLTGVLTIRGLEEVTKVSGLDTGTLFCEDKTPPKAPEPIEIQGPNRKWPQLGGIDHNLVAQ